MILEGPDALPMQARWTAFLADHDGMPPLDVATAWLAAEEGSGATVPGVMDALDALAHGIRLPPRAQPVDAVARIVHHLFEDEGLRGDVENYDHPVNSCIDAVIERRRGLPILLSVVTVEVARRVGVPLDGVGFPGHFLVGTRTTPRFFIDPFHHGRIQRADAMTLELARILDRSPQPDEIERALAPAHPADVLLRISNNLVRSWLRRGNLDAALRNADRRVALRPDVPELWRDRGLLRAQLSMAADAATDLTHYLAARPDAEDVPRLSMQLSMLLR